MIEDKEMVELRKEDTTLEEIEQTFYGVKTYHSVLDSANIEYPVSIERGLQVLEEVGNLQEKIEVFKNGRKTK